MGREEWGDEVGADGKYLAAVSDAELADLLGYLKGKSVGWGVLPMSNDGPYVGNFRLQARLREVATVLNDSGLRFGIEYVGPKTSCRWTSTTRRAAGQRMMGDGERELPASSGVKDVKTLLGSLEKIGFEGPVRAEPVNDAADGARRCCSAAMAALKKAYAAV